LHTVLHHSVQDEEAEALHHAASHKRSKSAASTGNDRHKQRHISTAQSLAEVKNTVRGVMDVLTVAICDIASSSKSNMYSNAIATVVEDQAFSQDDMDDTFNIFTKNPRVAETYAAIPDVSARTRYLQKCLGEFQVEKYGSIRTE